MTVMTNVCRAVALVSGLLLAPVSAFSADLGGYPGGMKDGPYERPAIYAQWTGLYVGLQGGYLWGDAGHSFSNGAPSDNSDPDGFIGGGHIGYNLQSGSIVYGIEADIEGGDVGGSFTNLTGLSSTGAVDLNWQGSLRARLGVVHGSMLFYATGGWAFGDFDFSGGPAPGPACCGYSETLNGWTIGGGIEWALSKNLTTRFEYRYTDFGRASGDLAPGYVGVIMPVELETHAIRAGLSYKF
jgi:outer membrane immunogenic protein